jgi:hypothetical protein
VAVVFDDLFGIPVTSRAVGSPDDALCRPHHSLESLAVECDAIAVPGCDTARQDALNCASVKFCQGFG